jgi:chorismate dehydratase
LPLLESLPEGMTLTMGTPGQLNQLYSEGKLDIGAMSAHFLLASGDFEVIPTLSISSQNEVGSVFFYSKLPLNRLNMQDSIIGVPVSSATSICLLKILLTEELGFCPQFVYGKDPSLDDSRFDAVLMIGDAALDFDESLKKRSAEELGQLHRFDMGSWWRRHYGLPMVFGLWGARRSYYQASFDDFQTIAELLGDCWRRGLGEKFNHVLDEAVRRTGLDRSLLQEYFRDQLEYDFEEQHIKSLALFEQLAEKHKLLVV